MSALVSLTVCYWLFRFHILIFFETIGQRSVLVVIVW
jgi:hypothetical protein